MTKAKLQELRSKVYKCTISGIIVYVDGFNERSNTLSLKELDGRLQINLPEANIDLELTEEDTLEKAVSVIERRKEKERGRINHSPLFSCKCSLCRG
jgi:hypothetical protein